ncbi:hypothetical protein HMPREF0518_1592, partial [Lactobacillus helveticus DSM 20075 = CGMCC 1.1877]
RDVMVLPAIVKNHFVKTKPYTIKKARINGLFIFAYLKISQSIYG